jgi:hypothetical protein
VKLQDLSIGELVCVDSVCIVRIVSLVNHQPGPFPEERTGPRIRGEIVKIFDKSKPHVAEGQVCGFSVKDLRKLTKLELALQ